MLAHSVTPFQMGGWVHTIRDVLAASPQKRLSPSLAACASAQQPRSILPHSWRAPRATAARSISLARGAPSRVTVASQSGAGGRRERGDEEPATTH